MLGLFYAALFAVELFFLIRSCRRKKKLWPVLTGNILSIALSLFLLWYFDTLPGYGFMPGFAYFPEVFYSLCAAAAFLLLSLVTLLCMLLRRKR